MSSCARTSWQQQRHDAGKRLGNNQCRAGLRRANSDAACFPEVSVQPVRHEASALMLLPYHARLSHLRMSTHVRYAGNFMHRRERPQNTQPTTHAARPQDRLSAGILPVSAPARLLLAAGSKLS